GVRFDFETYHEQWNSGMLEALAANTGITGEAYRTRQNFQPVVTVALAKPLTLEVGASFERFGNPGPIGDTDVSHALLASLRYHQRLVDSDYPQDVDASYSLRAASRLLGSDFAFVSHTASLHYRVSHGRHKLTESLTVGGILGRAPLSDRYVAGNSYFLRG